MRYHVERVSDRKRMGPAETLKDGRQDADRLARLTGEAYRVVTAGERVWPYVSEFTVYRTDSLTDPRD